MSDNYYEETIVEVTHKLSVKYRKDSPGARTEALDRLNELKYESFVGCGEHGFIRIEEVRH